MSSNFVLTASGTDDTPACSRAHDCESRPKSGEKWRLFETAATKCKKKPQHKIKLIEMNINTWGLFVFLLFIL